MAIDNVTLLQIARGAKMYRCRFFRSPVAYSFKSMEKLERGQLVLVHMVGSPERPQKGSQRKPRMMRVQDVPLGDEEEFEAYEHEVIAPGFAVARVIEEDVDFEPLHGITYCWVVAKLDEEELNRMPEWDRECRKKVRLGAAIREAEAAVQGIGLDPMPPGQQIETEKVPSSPFVLDPRDSVSSAPGEDDIPF